MNLRTVLTKLVQLVVVLIVVTFVTRALLLLVPPAGHIEEVLIPLDPSNPVVAQRQQEVRQELGLDDPIWEQYWDWLSDFVQGDMGYYYTPGGPGRPVLEAVKDAYPVSLELIIYAEVLTLLFAIPLGIYSAYRAGRFSDKAVNAGAFAAIALPNFALALLLAWIVGVKLGWLPNVGYTRPTDDLVEHIKTMIMPTVSLAAGQIAVYQRLLRSDMIQTLQEDFVLVAKAKGITNRRILWRHALRPSSLTLLTVAGINMGTLISGAVVIETIFGLPGLGTLLFQAILRRQFIALQSLVAIVAGVYVVINFIVDLLYRYLDPRIRDARAVA